MSQGANSTPRRATVRPARHVSFTDAGDVVVRVPAGLVRLLAVIAALLALAAVPFVFAGVAAAVAAVPLALFGVPALLAGALFAPFAALVLVTLLLG